MITRSRFSVLKPSPLDNDAALIAWLPFDGGAGTDYSGNQNNAVAVGSPVFTPSDIADAYVMSTGNYFQVTTKGASNPIATNVVTAACWFKPNGTTRGDIISIWGGNGSSNDQFVLLYGLTSAKVEMFGMISGAARSSGASSTAMVVGQRYHLVGTYDGSAVKVYINGKLESSTNWSGNLGVGTSDPIQIGTSASSTNSANGSVADARVYNRALSGGEVNALYNQGIARLSLSPDEWQMPALFFSSTQYAAFSTPQHSLSQVTQNLVGY